MTLSPARLVDAAVRQYLEYGDFNGLPAYTATALLGCTLDELKQAARDLVERGELSVLFGDRHPNPHIRAFTDEPAVAQIEKLDRVTSSQFVLYPTPATLSAAVDRTKYAGRPYSLAMALGEAQLDFASFEPVVLDHYRRDPRYRFWTDDVQGHISVTNEAYESSSFPERDKVLLESFAYAYSEDFERAVAVFYTDLARLSPEHQRTWATYELSSSYRMHPDAARALIAGDWGLRVSLGDAFLEEMRTINRMAELIGMKPFFKRAYDSRPTGFAFMLRPTRRELHDFVLLLDKMLSENINVDFFPATIDRTTERTREHGKIQVQGRGTISMLEDWLNKTVRFHDPAPKDEIIRELKEIRRLRQQPADAVNEDTYDPTLFKEQRRLFLAGYDVVRTLRMVFGLHPKARPAIDEMNEQVRDGEIWSI